MRIIKSGDRTIAWVFDGQFEEGTKPLTDEKWALQVINLKHPKGKVLVTHRHQPMSRTTESLMEMLMVITGRARVTIYDQQTPIEAVELSAGQGVMLVDGGIGIEVLEDAQMLEFKNGPFLEDKIVI
ncbi:hypothetical protein A2994_00010 [candidate division Kazan bacterium RIFCSPLOWO2_01_FULL_48_13]|uniref:Uncharacterized protein n=1 Tax=candidate division Kazan bacterium RIFCSPLOWO2_01_FULL_48_13 TaxID=1798539 RepID=A0A1F4PNL6_UNCK3|nr:MAG: hypothetical protein A2994_00010 [candidate division Kazan bacterium RIFCSPLOWO2_01_FULL_48_13]